MRLQISITNLHLLQSSDAVPGNMMHLTPAEHLEKLIPVRLAVHWNMSHALWAHRCNPVQLYNPIYCGATPNVCSNGCVMLCGLCRPLWPDSLCRKATDKTYHLACRTHLLSTSSCLSCPNTGLVEGFLFCSRIQCWILHHTSAGTSSQKHPLHSGRKHPR